MQNNVSVFTNTSNWSNPFISQLACLDTAIE